MSKTFRRLGLGVAVAALLLGALSGPSAEAQTPGTAGTVGTAGGQGPRQCPGGATASSTLSDRIGKQVNCARGRAGAAVINLSTGETILHNADESYGTSSTIKSVILYALLRKADKENINLSTTMLNVGKEFGENQGDLLEENKSYSLDYLAQIMIDYSNNWASNRLIQYLGTKDINGFDMINTGYLKPLGLSKIKLQRFFVGPGVPSVHGFNNEEDDYRAGFDNLATPREMTTFFRKVYENAGLLSAARHTAFFQILGAVPTKGYTDDYLAAGVDPLWQANKTVTIQNKAGINRWDGPVGTFKSKPALGNHDQYSEAGLFRFRNNQVVLYAMFIDDAVEDSGPGPISCVGYEVVRHYSGVSTGVVPALCG